MARLKEEEALYYKIIKEQNGWRKNTESPKSNILEIMVHGSWTLNGPKQTMIVEYKPGTFDETPWVIQTPFKADNTSMMRYLPVHVSEWKYIIPVEYVRPLFKYDRNVVGRQL